MVSNGCFVSVYRAAQHQFKEAFLTELVQLCTKETLPILLGGDFNITRDPQEKNNCVTNGLSCLTQFIDAFNLRELPSCSNLRKIRQDFILHRLGELKFLHTTVQTLSRYVSNHTPLFLNTGESSKVNTTPMFKFELAWLLRDGFFEIFRDT